MLRASKYSYKKNETSHADVSNGASVPEEIVYHLELVILMKQWLLGFGWLIDFEFNEDLTSKFADIALTSPTTKDRYVLELVAHARDGPVTRNGTVLDHLDRVENFYSKIKGLNSTVYLLNIFLDVKELWVINFTTRQPTYGYAWSNSKKVTIIHIYHDLEWNKATVSFSEEELITVKLI